MNNKRNIREFSTGANRNDDTNKIMFAGHLSPIVLERYCEYMHKHKFLEDGTVRSSDNWKKGIPKDAYMQSMMRHFMDVWLNHDGFKAREEIEEALCALLFNVSGYLHEEIKETRKK